MNTKRKKISLQLEYTHKHIAHIEIYAQMQSGLSADYSFSIV